MGGLILGRKYQYHQYAQLVTFICMMMGNFRPLKPIRENNTDSNNGTKPVPTYILPTVHILPIRAVLISPSNMIPSVGPERRFEQGDFWSHRFYVTQANYGVFQILNDASEASWTTVDQFTGHHVLQGRVRYLSTLMQPESIDAKFSDRIHLTCIHAMNITANIRLILPIEFQRIKIDLDQNRKLIIYLEKDMSISDEPPGSAIHRIGPTHLHTSVVPVEQDDLIFYTIVLAPKHGHLFLQSPWSFQAGLKNPKKKYLGVNSQFTQKHITNGELFYNFRRVVDSNALGNAESSQIIDGFDFRLHVPGAQLRGLESFHVVVTTDQRDSRSLGESYRSMRIVQQNGTLFEGAMLVLTSTVLDCDRQACSANYGVVYVQFLTLPNHGSLRYRKFADVDVWSSARTTYSFPIKYIDQSRLSYLHDGTESFVDGIQFQFMCINPDLFLTQTDDPLDNSIPQRFQVHSVRGTLHMNIIPVNDHAPILISQDLLVGYNRSTRVPNHWIHVEDRDREIDGADPLNFPISYEIVKHYERLDVTYPKPGEFVDLMSGQSVNRFNLWQVMQHRLTFRHWGAPIVEMELTVTDGSYVVRKSSLINASLPVLQVIAPRLLSTTASGGVLLFLEVLTNVPLQPRDIQLQLIQPPCFGALYSEKSPHRITQFTYEDVLRYRIRYNAKNDFNSESTPFYASVSNMSVNPGGQASQCNWQPTELDLIQAGKILRAIAWDHIQLLAIVKYNQHEWREKTEVNIAITPDRLYAGLISELETTAKDTCQDLWLSQPVLPKRFTVVHGGVTSLQVGNSASSLKPWIPHHISYQLLEPPKFGVLSLTTPSFSIYPIDRFTLSDLVVKRVSYLQNSPVSPLYASLVRTNYSMTDCFTLSRSTQPTFCASNDPKAKMAGFQSVIDYICVEIVDAGPLLKTHDLTVSARQQRSLNYAGLSVTQMNNLPTIRHDEPVERGYGEQQSAKDTMFHSLSVNMVQNSSTWSYSENHSNIPDFVYLIKRPPKFGDIRSKSLKQSVLAFSSEDLRKDDVIYSHESALIGTEDYVELRAIALKESNVPPSDVHVKFTVKADGERVQLIHNKSANILLGSSVILERTHLLATVPGRNESEIRYEVLTAYAGSVTFGSRLQTTVRTFTQQDIDQGNIQFIQSGNAIEDRCGFDFQIHSPSHLAGPFSYSLLIRNLSIRLLRNQLVAVFPLGLERITSWHLSHRIVDMCCDGANSRSPDVDHAPESFDGALREFLTQFTIVYSVLSYPKHGTLGRVSNVYRLQARQTQMPPAQLASTQHFTQSNARWPTNSMLADQLLLNVSIVDRPASSPSRSIQIGTSQLIHLNLSISYGHVHVHNQHRLFNIKPLEVIEGGTETIDMTVLNWAPLKLLYHRALKTNRWVPDLTDVRLTLKKSPRHGSLWNGQNQMAQGDPFEPHSSAQLLYKHDDSESTSDYFSLRVSTGSLSSPSNQNMIEIPIQISPINDQRAQLLQPTETSMESSFSHRSNRTDRLGAVIVLAGTYLQLSTRHLHVIDADTPPSLLRFHITSPPEFGALCLTELGFDAKEAATTNLISGSVIPCFPCNNPCIFSQADVNSGLVHFQASAKLFTTAMLDSFTFRVEEHNQPSNTISPSVIGTLVVRILPSKIDVTTSPLLIHQGETRTVLHKDQIHVAIDSLQHSRIEKNNATMAYTFLFTVIESAKHGHICFDTVPVKQFTMEQLKTGHLAYEQSDTSASNDSIILRVTLSDYRQIQWNQLFSPSHRFVTREPSRFSELYANLRLVIHVTPLLTTRTIVLMPGHRVLVNVSTINATQVWKLIQSYGAHKDESRRSDYPMLHLPTAAHSLLGRFRIHGRLFVSSNYPDAELSSAINISLHAIEANMVQFEAYETTMSKHSGRDVMEEQLPYTLRIREGIQPAEGLLTIRVARSIMTSSLHDTSVIGKDDRTFDGSFWMGGDEKTVSVTVIGLAVAFSLITLVLIIGTAFYLYKCRKQDTGSTEVSVKGAGNTVMYSRTEDGPMQQLLQKQASAYTITQNALPVTSRSSLVYNPQGSTSMQCLETLNSMPSQSTVSSSICRCDFSDAVVYLTPGLPNDNQTPVMSTQNTNYILVSDLQLRGKNMEPNLQIISPHLPGDIQQCLSSTDVHLPNTKQMVDVTDPNPMKDQILMTHLRDDLKLRDSMSMGPVSLIIPGLPDTFALSSMDGVPIWVNQSQSNL